ncbi:hypothetical protein [Mucilaginibacter gynuensis]
MYKATPSIIVDEIGLTFSNKQYFWQDLDKVIFTGKKYPIPLGREEAMELTFKNGDKKYILDDLYSNSSEMKLFIKKKTSFHPRGEIEGFDLKSNPSLEYFTIFKGLPLFSFDIVSRFAIAIMLFYIPITQSLSYINMTLIILFIFLLLGITIGFSYFFSVSESYFMVKNHFLPGYKKLYHISSIREVVFETTSNRPNRLRLITNDFKTKLFYAASLKHKTWLELKTALRSKSIKVRNEL